MIRFDAFTKRYGQQAAVRELSLAIEPGEVVVLLGPNGSGKTTSLKAAAGLIHPTSGAVRLGDPAAPATIAPATIAPATIAAARRVCAYLPQRASFADALTGREVAEFYAALRGIPSRRVEEMLRLVGLAAAAGRAVGTYSGGMVQRLGLAVAMLPDAPVLLLDEPTAALDPDGLAIFQTLVERGARAGRTVLFTTHQLNGIEELADRFAVLVEGRLVALLTRRELVAQLPDAGVLRLHEFYRSRLGENAA